MGVQSGELAAAGAAAAIGTAALVAALALLLVYLAARAQTARIATGREEIVGARGKARSPVGPEGTVFVCGELWQARAATGESIAAGEEVEVVAVRGLTLIVRRAAPEDEG